MKKFFLFLVIAALTIFAVACGSNNESQGNVESDQKQETSNNAENTQGEKKEEPKEEIPTGILNIRGSDTMVNLTQALAEFYMDEVNLDSGLSVTGGGSGTGIAALINNDVDMAIASRDIKDTEIAEAAANGVEVHEFVVGQDGIAVAVHKDNPVKQLTMGQIKDIFVGNITNWADLGWADGGEITVYSRQSNSGTYVFFNETVMDGEDFAAGTMYMPGTSAIKQAIEQEVNAIGYIGVGYVDDNIDAVEVAAEEGGTFYSPLDKANVASADYPVARALYFYTNGKPEGLLFHFLNWVLQDPDAKNVVEETGFFEIGAYQEANKKVYETLGLQW